MPESQVMEIVEAAPLIVDGYAMMRDGANIRIVNLNSGRVAVCAEDGKILETSMDDIEAAIAIGRFRDNRQFLDA